MNICDHIQVFTREDVEDNAYVLHRPLILLSSQMYELTREMVHAERESLGMMFYSKKDNNGKIQKARDQNHLIVRHMINIGYGTSTVVYPEDDKLAAVNTILKDNPDIGFIEYHTHTFKTGILNTDNFSGIDGDISTLARKASADNKYMHVLFTPSHILTFGLNMPYVGILKNKESNMAINNDSIEFDKHYRKILGDLQSNASNQ